MSSLSYPTFATAAASASGDGPSGEASGCEKGAVAHDAQAAAFGQGADKIERRVLKKAGSVQLRKRALGLIDAHDPLKPPDFGKTFGDQPVGGRGVGMMDLQNGVAPERCSPPDA
jgi:hypothetical protein